MTLISQQKDADRRSRSRIPSANRLHSRYRVWCGADGAYVLEDRAATRSFSSPRESAGYVVALHKGARTPRNRAEVCSGSCEPLLEGFAAAATADQDAALGEQPRDRAADQGVAGELAIAVPDRTLKRERQLAIFPAL